MISIKQKWLKEWFEIIIILMPGGFIVYMSMKLVKYFVNRSWYILLMEIAFMLWFICDVNYTL